MAYATLDDLKVRYSVQELIRLTDHNRPAAQIDVPRVTAAITDADALIDSHLAACFALPLSNATSAQLTSLSCRIARYFLYDDKPTEAVKAGYDAAIAFLKNIEENCDQLRGDDGQPVGEIICNRIEVVSDCKVFGGVGQFAPATDRKNVNRYGALYWGW
ncbi:MAG: gp436 family protein [Betaproteobacteria bacterium]